MSNLVNWARKELSMIPCEEGDELQEAVNNAIMEIVEKFAEQGHSGFSAVYTIQMLTRLLDWIPITPLTGEDDEWEAVEYDVDGMEQNIRCSTVFRLNKDNATAYDINGRVFSTDKGETWFSDSNSSVPVTFPYTVPVAPQYIMIEEDVINDDAESHTELPCTEE